MFRCTCFGYAHGFGYVRLENAGATDIAFHWRGWGHLFDSHRYPRPRSNMPESFLRLRSTPAATLASWRVIPKFFWNDSTSWFTAPVPPSENDSRNGFVKTSNAASFFSSCAPGDSARIAA